MSELNKMQPDSTQPKTPLEKGSRVSIINTVQTPLGFFVLVVLIVEAILGITASSSSGNDKTFLIGGMLALIFLLVLIVSGMAVFKPPSLYGKAPTTQTNVVISSVSQDILAGTQIVKQPKILLASSMSDLKQLQNELQLLQAAFPKSIVAKSDLTSSSFLELLRLNKYDIVQLNATVRVDGSVEFKTKDAITGDALVRYLELHNTSLLILTSCNSVPLAAKLAAKINMIAATGNLPNDVFKQWQKVFYGLLSDGYLLSKAYRLANYGLQVIEKDVEGTPLSILLVMKQDVIFKK